jgi:LuxR family maltose regulon positive regulatory protein
MQILSTKLSIPPIRSRLVPRLRLVQKLNEGLECGFILVSAPAGYGKTTLLSAWLEQLQFPSAWLSLDDKDNDLSRFLAYFIAACREVDPSFDVDFGTPPGISSQAEVEAQLTLLINHLAQASQSFCVVLDDFHVIQEQLIHAAVNFLLEHRPESLRLVIATRADPPVHLARLRARCDMLELRMADLRFTPQESADFLSCTMGLKVKSEDVARLTLRTEGWIAGLQMAALSMQNSSDVSSFIAAFTGSHHYIFDYLLGEILGQQSPEIQHFLLSTSILDQLSAPLCEAMLDADERPTTSHSSASILEDLEHSNLFIIPMDHEQRWYRYHPLFAELLRSFLQKNNPELIPVLHNRASSWYEDQGMVSDAIRHSFAVNDWERIVRLISANIFALLEQNELTSVARQLESLTKEKTSARPWLLIGRAWLAAYTGQLSSVEPILKMAETEIDSLKSEVELQTLGGHIAAIRAYANWIGDQRELATQAAQVALEWLPPDERLIRCQAATLLGLTLYDFDERAKAFELALIYARDCKVSHVTIFAYGCYAWLLSMQARLREAYATCQEAIRLARTNSASLSLPTLSHVYTTLSAVLLEWNDLEGALHYSKEAVDLARRWEQADALHFALDNYGYVLFASGNVEGAFDILSQVWQVAHRTSSWFEQITLSQEIEWYLCMDNLVAALQCLSRAHLDIDEPFKRSIGSFKSTLMPLTFVQIYLAQKQYHKALTVASLDLEDMEKRKVGHYIIRLLLLQALAYYGLKQEQQALESVKGALTLAAPGGYLRIFILEGSKMIPLLQQARSAGIMPEYIDRILEAFDLGTKALPVQTPPQSQLVEPLSGREMEVLQLLAQGYTDKMIAENLVIAPETVHKHLKNIYSKLDVHSRLEATLRARKIGLL